MNTQITPLRTTQRFLILLSLAFLWPAFINGGAFYFPDTTAYIRGPDAMLHHAVGWRSEWTQPATLADGVIAGSSIMRTAVPASEKESASRAAPEDFSQSVFSNRMRLVKNTKPVLLGRSVFYGILPFGGMAMGSDWLTIVVQALIAGAVVIGFTRHFVDPCRRRFNWICLGVFLLLAATPLPFFTSMLMPDFMAGAGIVAASALMIGWRQEGWSGCLFWFAVIAAAALMHSANILILLAIAVPALFLALMLRDDAAMRGAALVATGALLGLVGEATFAHMVTHVTGAAPIRPPFVTARLIEDGPGLAYLDRTCPKSGFLLCRFRSRMPAGSDVFLWSTDPAQGVFKAAAPATQRALSAEQRRFVVAVATTFPLGVAEAAMLAAFRQMTLLSLVEFNYSPEEYLNHLPPAAMRLIATSRAFTGTMPVRMAEVLLWPMVFGSLLAVAIALFSPTKQQVAGYGIVIVAGWLANNIICGMLSTPHDRYQARIAWMLPLVATLIAVRLIDFRKKSHQV